MKIFICIASKREINNNKLRSQFKNADLEIKFIGIGVKNREALKSLIEKGKFSIVINAGTAGIISDNVKIFDIILPSVFINFMNGETIKCTTRFLKNTIKNFKTTGIITTDRPITTNNQKIEIQRKYPNAGIVDMESYHIAKICKDAGIPFTAIKIATDYSNTETDKLFYKNLPEAKEILTDAVIELVNNFIKNE